MQKLRLADLIDLKAVQKMAEANYRSAGIPIGIIDASDGSVLAGAGWQDICLKFHRAHPESLAGCQESDRYIKSYLSSGKPVSYRCQNGLWDIGMPIIVSGQHLATLFLGQFFYEDEVIDKDFYIRQAERYHYNQKEYLAALARVPVLKREKVENILEYNQSFTVFLTELAEKSLASIIADRSLKESQQRLSILFGKASDAIFVSSLDGQLVHVNEQACRATGYTEEELLRLNVTDIDAEIGGPEALDTFFQAISPGEPVTIESRHRRKDGSTYPVEVRIALLQTDGESHVLGIARDITGRKRMEERLQHAQKMEAVGNLAGGIAHDFNNILSPIIGFAELLIARLPDGGFESDSARRILEAGRRGSDLVNQILAFSRRSEQRLKPVWIQPILQEVIKLGRSTIPANIEIVAMLKPDCGPVLADSTQLHQIAMNLLTNAYQAIDETEGIISIELRETAFEREDSGRGGLGPGRYALLSVSDTGCGIEPEVIGSIFEPYFTTKKQGKGTGLGLAVVYGIVKEYQGDIRVYSEPGKGTTFNVFLPVCEDEATIAAVETGERFPRGSERILIVDDEEAIIEFESQILGRLGYRITAHTSSTEALKTFKLDPEAFDLVLTDMSMPHMTGDQLLREIHEIRPELPVIVCTGFSERMQKENAAAMGVKAFLMKPVSISDLAIAIRNGLDGVG